MFRTLLISLLIVHLSSFLSAQSTQSIVHQSKVSERVLERIQDTDQVEYLVHLTQQADLSEARLISGKNAKAQYVYNALTQTAEQTQAGLIQLLKARGAAYQSFWVVNSIWVKSDLATLTLVAARSEVAYLSDNHTLEMTQPVESEILSASQLRGRGIEWGIEHMQADDVWQMGYKGEGVVIGGQDTGYEWDHPALRKSYRGNSGSSIDHNYSWHDAIHNFNPMHSDSISDCPLDATVPCDDHNHGTHTMGTMTGEEKLSGNQIGVAPKAKWIGCRNMERGYGTPTTYIECFQWFMAPTDLNGQNPNPAMAPHVINNSWACPPEEGCDSSSIALMQVAVDNLRSSGVVVVASAGNSGSQGCGSINNPPAIFASSFSIGAISSTDTIAGFSSRGPVIVDGSNRLKPNVSAPGVWVRSAIKNGGYANFSGTSMAGPHVAGLVALLISAQPSLAGQVDQIEDIIEKTARPMTTDQDCGNIPGSQVPNHTYGHGNVDALAAVKEALNPTAIEELEQSTFAAVYPNPFQDQLILEFGALRGTVQLELYNAMGQIIVSKSWQQQAAQSQQVSLPALPAGIYSYRILYKNQVQSGRLVKN